MCEFFLFSGASLERVKLFNQARARQVGGVWVRIKKRWREFHLPPLLFITNLLQT